MKKTMILLLMLVPFFTSCAHLAESDDVDPVIHGSWVGEGRFYDRDLKAEYGTVPVTLEIASDNTVSGMVGHAAVTAGVIKSRPQDFLIEAALEGDVFESGTLPGEDKDSLVVILQAPEGAATDGDFHLKTNLAFDFGMRAGAVKLARAGRDSY